MWLILKDWLEKDKGQAVATLLIIFLVGILGFGLGRWGKIESQRPLIHWEMPSEDQIVNTTSVVSSQEQVPVPSGGVPRQTSGQLVASKNSDKYHLPSCPGAQRIKPENQIWFNSAAEAKLAGYLPAGNCPGLK